MSDRYKRSELQLLRNTERSVLYCSKRNRGGFGEGIAIYRTNQESPAQKQKRFTADLAENKSRNKFESSSFMRNSISKMRKKLSLALEPNPEECDIIEYREVVTDPSKKMPTPFRINFFNNHSKRKQYLQRLADKQARLSKDAGREEFQASNISLKKRGNLKEWKQNKLFEFQRDLLRTHGEDKCFYNAIKFRRDRGDKQSSRQSLNFRKKLRNASARENSLEYSMQEVDLSDLQPWKKSAKEVQWLSFSQLQS